MISQDRGALRAFYSRSWSRYKASQPLEPLELMVAEVVADHPEYHAVVEDETQHAEDFSVERGESNPFLHLGMHVALREQAGADRPAGFSVAYGQLCAASGERHGAEHKMMDCLGEAMWASQRTGRAPDQFAFLECVRTLVPFGVR
jgi:hypothetical protein